jgi:hypothetical protein
LDRDAQDGEARPLAAQPLEQFDGVVGRVDADRHRPVPDGQQGDRARGDLRVLATGELLAVVADQLGLSARPRCAQNATCGA